MLICRRSKYGDTCVPGATINGSLGKPVNPQFAQNANPLIGINRLKDSLFLKLKRVSDLHRGVECMSHDSNNLSVGLGSYIYGARLATDNCRREKKDSSLSKAINLKPKHQQKKYLDVLSKKFTRIAKWSGSGRRSTNSVIHGDNLEVLDELVRVQPQSVRCAYIDPPYNNGEIYNHYVDTMGHEKWLKSIEARLVLIHTLLQKDGSLWISIDDTGMHYLKVLADKIFGRSNFVTTIVWEHRTTRENRRVFSNNHEYLLVYAKSQPDFKNSMNTLPITEDVRLRYKNPDNDPRGPWQSISANVQDGHGTPQQFYVLVAPNGRRHIPPKGRCWCYSKEKMQIEIAQNNVWFGKDGNGVPRLKKFLSERKTGLTPETLWKAGDVGTTSDAKKHLLSLFPDASLFDTPKPESLIERILSIGTNPGDLVLDAYLGSGTTTAVAHKMNRRYIGIENGDHSKTHCANRMKKVIKGDRGGISEKVEWHGGGDFDFYQFRNKV